MNSRRNFHLILALIALLAVIWAAAYASAKYEEQRVLGALFGRSDQLAKFFENHVSASFRYADDYIRSVRRAFKEKGSIDAVRRLLTDVPPNPSVISHITIMDANGIPQFIGNGREEKKPKPGVGGRDRPYFTNQQKSERDSVFISPARKGRNTGLVTVRLVRRLTDENGEFAGVIFAAVNAEQLMGFYEASRTGPNSTATLVGLDHRIRVRISQDGLVKSGASVAKSNLWNELRQNSVGSYRQTSIIDQVPRYWSYRKVSGFPIVAVIGSAIPDALTSNSWIKNSIYLVAGLVSIIGAILVYLSWRAVRMTRLETEILERKANEVALGQAIKAAEAASHAKSEFLASMSHELRTPLNAISGFAQLLQYNSRNPVSDKQDDHIAAILDASDHLLELVNDILDLNAIEADKIEFNIENVSVPETISESIALTQPLADERKIRIAKRIKSDDQLVSVSVDRLRLRQILINLLSNAVKYNKIGGSVTVDGWETADGTFHIAVTDSGRGIDQKDHPAVFEMFNRFGVDSTRTREGTGIGLFVSKLLVDRLGGRIGFESTVGIGSTFWIELPLSVDQPKRGNRNKSPKSAS